MSEKCAKNPTKVSKNVGIIRQVRLYLSRTKDRFDRIKVGKFPTILLNKVGHLNPGIVSSTDDEITTLDLRSTNPSHAELRVVPRVEGRQSGAKCSRFPKNQKLPQVCWGGSTCGGEEGVADRRGGCRKRRIGCLERWGGWLEAKLSEVDLGGLKRRRAPRRSAGPLLTPKSTPTEFSSFFLQNMRRNSSSFKFQISIQ